MSLALARASIRKHMSDCINVYEVAQDGCQESRRHDLLSNHPGVWKDAPPCSWLNAKVSASKGRCRT